jgi:hypothetical protein
LLPEDTVLELRGHISSKRSPFLVRVLRYQHILPAMAALPEEVILQVFNNLERLSDVHAVMLTCKQFHRIPLDIEAKKIS